MMQMALRARMLSAKQAQIDKSIRFLRSLVQRRGSCERQMVDKTEIKSEGGKHLARDGISVLVQLHAFAWNGQSSSRHHRIGNHSESEGTCRKSPHATPSHEASAGTIDAIEESKKQRNDDSTTLLQYVTAHKRCPGVLHPSMGRDGGMLGRIMLRILRRWHANTAFILVAVGFRSVNHMLRGFTLWKVPCLSSDCRLDPLHSCS